MPHRVGGLRAERGGDLDHAVEARRHEDLLVQLRALAQVRATSEVRRLEEGRATLRAGAGELRRLHLNETLPAQVRADRVQDDGPNAEDRAPLRLPEVEEAVVEARVHLRADLVGDGEGQGRGGFREDLEGRGEELPAIADLLVRLDHAPGDDGGLPDDL